MREPLDGRCGHAVREDAKDEEHDERRVDQPHVKIFKSIGRSVGKSMLIDLPERVGETAVDLEDVLRVARNRARVADVAPLRALIFDSYYDRYRGAIPSIRVVDGVVRKGMQVAFGSHPDAHRKAIERFNEIYAYEHPGTQADIAICGVFAPTGFGFSGSDAAPSPAWVSPP